MLRKTLVFSLLSFLLMPAALYAAEGCTLNTVQGDVRVLREGQDISANAKDSLKKGDRLKTGDGCMADMSMNDMAGCRVLPGSEVEVMGWKPENMSLAVATGNVILNLKQLPKDSSFKVETPTAVATVRGTQFWGRVDNAAVDNPVTTFAVREGSVEITPKGVVDGGPITLTAGQALDITKVSGTYAVRSALAAEMAAMEQAETIPTEIKA